MTTKQPRTDAGRDLMYFLNTETGGGDYSQSIIAIEAEASQRQEALEDAARSAFALLHTIWKSSDVLPADEADLLCSGMFATCPGRWCRSHRALLDPPQPVEP